MRELSNQESEVLRAVGAVVETAPFDLGDEIKGALVLQSDRPEWQFLRREIEWVTRNFSQAAVVGELSAVGVINRTTRTLIVVKGFQLTAGAGAGVVTFFHGRLPNAAFEAEITSENTINLATDVRNVRSPTQEANMAGREIAAASAGFGLQQYGFIPAGTAGQFYPPLGFGPLAILPPGSFVMAVASIVNQVMSGLFVGRDKPLYLGERA